MKRLLLLIISLLPICQTGCLTYSWERGWQYDENYAKRILAANVDKRGLLEKQRDEFYDTPRHRLNQHFYEDESVDPKAAGMPKAL